MSTHLNNPVAYLEDSDIDSQGNLVNSQIPKDIPVVVMLQASWCPHCTSAKPAFQEFADKYQGKVFAATVQADGDKESEKKLGKRVSQIKPGFRGFPDYVLYKNGRRVDKEIGGRGVSDLAKFAGV